MDAHALFQQAANGDITEAYDRVEDVINTHGSLLAADVAAELHRAKDSLFRARLLTDAEAVREP